MAIRSSDQISIVDLTDGYSVMLTNDSHTFLGDTSKAIAASTQTTVIAMCGASQVAASVNLDDVVKPTGVNVTKDTDATQPTLTIAVTTAVTAGGVVDIPIQLDNGNITIHKLFTFQIAFKGQTGAAGSSAQWYTGTKITGTSTTATIFSDSGITAAKVGDMYLNTSTQNTYRCTVAGAADVAKWVYVSNIKGATGGACGEVGVRLQHQRRDRRSRLFSTVVYGHRNHGHIYHSHDLQRFWRRQRKGRRHVPEHQYPEYLPLHRRWRG